MYEIDFDWLFYIAKVHLNYTKEEFLDSTHAEICKLWKTHIKFNGWTFKNGENGENELSYIDDVPFL